MILHYEDGLPAVAADAGDPYAPTIRDVIVRTRRLAEVLDGCLNGPTQNPEDLHAVTWILQSLEDIEATAIGLVQSEYQQPPAKGSLPPLPLYQRTDQGPVVMS